MILVEVCWRMPGKATTVPFLHTDKLAVESPTQWLATEQTRVPLSMIIIMSCIIFF